jgi:hypothetical protein
MLSLEDEGVKQAVFRLRLGKNRNVMWVTEWECTSKIAQPVIRRLPLPIVIILRRPPDIPIPILTLLTALTLPEPLMLITGMIHHKIHHILHLPLMQAPDQLIMILHRPVLGMDVPIIAYIIPHVDLRGGEDGAKPDHVDAQRFDVVELGSNAGDVAEARTGGVEEGGRVDLIDAGFFPPGAADAHWCLRGGHCGQMGREGSKRQGGRAKAAELM